MNNKSTHTANNKVGHERDSRVFQQCLIGLFAGILLAAGFVYAAGRHFDALQQSAKNVEMRRERERLKNERQRLIMERESVLSPSQLEKEAHRIGLQSVSAIQINRLGESLNGEAALDAGERAKTAGSRRSEPAAAAFRTARSENKTARGGKGANR